MAVSGIQLKICGIKDPGDAEYIQELGVDFVGMIHFPKSPRHLDLLQVRAILPYVSVGKSVAVMVEPDLETLKQFRQLGVSNFQIHLKGDPNLDQVGRWAECVGPEHLWLVPKLPPGEDFPEEILAYSKTVLIDTYSAAQEGGTGKTGDWDGFRRLVSQYFDARFILAGGLNPDNIIDAIQQSGTRFLDVNSGVESAPGVKSRKLIDRIFDELSVLNSR